MMFDKRKWLAGFALSLPMLTACGADPWGGIEPAMFEDTVEIAAPREVSELPSALDVMVAPMSGSIGGGRYPEAASDARRWDVALHETEDGLYFRTPADFGIDLPARISEPVLDRDIEEIDRATGTVLRRAEVLEGAVYIVRSRSEGGCLQYAKMTPIELDEDEARVLMHVITNARCNDDRLPSTQD